jgi:hypothetical protein
VRECPLRARYGAGMKISIREAEGHSGVLVFLTEREADGVSQALRSRLEGKPGFQGPGYHLHLEDDDGSELTIGVLDPE